MSPQPLNIRSKILDLEATMPLAHVTKSGNVSIPKAWRDELGILPNSTVIMQRNGDGIVIQPMKNTKMKKPFQEIDEEMKQRKIVITREEAMNHDNFYS